MIRALVIAGVSSGVGKTTVTVGLLEAFRRLGLRVRAFKVGPDFIDPGFHAQVTGGPSYNLDGWICSRESVLETVARQAADADLALIEGVMGCFDGSDGKGEEGSTAQVAKWLGAPVVLVADARAMARSGAAVVLGFERFDPDLPIAGVIWNRVSGETHARWLDDALQQHCRALPLGWLPREEALALPERHLGLVTARERRLTREFLDALVSAVEKSVDLDRLLSLAKSQVEPRPPHPDPLPQRGRGKRVLSLSLEGEGEGEGAPAVKIGVAMDEAFQFYYPANFDLLKAAGAELVFWSPLMDSILPAVDGLYLGGGYPELYARELSANVTMREAIRAFAESGRPLYAECGGLMYCSRALEDLDGNEHPMVGLLPTTVRMKPKKLTLGYVEVEFAADSPLAPAGAQVRGHEFHYSRIDEVPASVPRVYRLRRRRGGKGGKPEAGREINAERAEGYLVDNALMSYVHLHFGSNPEIAAWFANHCRRDRSV